LADRTLNNMSLWLIDWVTKSVHGGIRMEVVRTVGYGSVQPGYRVDRLMMDFINTVSQGEQPCYYPQSQGTRLPPVLGMLEKLGIHSD